MESSADVVFWLAVFALAIQLLQFLIPQFEPAVLKLLQSIESALYQMGKANWIPRVINVYTTLPAILLLAVCYIAYLLSPFILIGYLKVWEESVGFTVVLLFGGMLHVAITLAGMTYGWFIPVALLMIMEKALLFCGYLLGKVWDFDESPRLIITNLTEPRSVGRFLAAFGSLFFLTLIIDLLYVSVFFLLLQLFPGDLESGGTSSIPLFLSSFIFPVVLLLNFAIVVFTPVAIFAVLIPCFKTALTPVRYLFERLILNEGGSVSGVLLLIAILAFWLSRPSKEPSDEGEAAQTDYSGMDTRHHYSSVEEIELAQFLG